MTQDPQQDPLSGIREILADAFGFTPAGTSLPGMGTMLDWRRSWTRS
jgi:hypothetical protein